MTNQFSSGPYHQSNGAVTFSPKQPDPSLPLEPFPDTFSHLNDFDKKGPFNDSGSLPHVHYEARIHPIRFRIRQFLLPYIRAETKILYDLQKASRNQLLDYYFSYSANLAAHTFYVLMLPLPLWLGYGMVVRDLIYILGYSIYITGFMKDFCCLPRPRSPPLHRITLSSYTAKEYGFPSSHSANATGVSLLMLSKILENWGSYSPLATWALVLILGLYYCSLIIGRVYCGMHGFLDIFVGSFLGAFCYVVRNTVKDAWDGFIIYGSVLGPLTSIAFNYCLIYFHCSPVDDCPCFDDSVAFVGVVIGLDISNWIHLRTFHAESKPGINDVSALSIPYSFAELGLIKSILRVLLGVGAVVAWKEISKPLLLGVYNVLSKLIKRGDYNAAKFKRIRSNTNSRREVIGDVQNIIKEMSSSTKDTIGPQSSIDIYELEQYSKNIESLDEKDKLFTCGAFKKRYDAEIIVRLIVYAGIPFMVIIGFSFLAQVVGLS